jgi:serine/threonine protein kinase
MRNIHEEANCLKELKYKHIVNVVDVFYEESSMKVVMEYVEGVNLKKYIDEKGAL